MTAPSRTRTAAAHMLAAWMGTRFYRTFRLTSEDDPAPFDFLLGRLDCLDLV